MEMGGVWTSGEVSSRERSQPGQIESIDIQMAVNTNLTRLLSRNGRHASL